MGKGKFLGEFEQLVLLAVLRMEGAGYGMSIRREIETQTGRDVSIGAVYATLERLQAKGYLVSEEGEASPVRGGRARRHYAIQPSGKRALIRSRRLLETMWEGVDASGGLEQA